MADLDPQVQIGLIDLAMEIAGKRKDMKANAESRISTVLKGFDEAYKALAKTVESA